MCIETPSIFQQGFSKNITSHYLSFLDLIDSRKIPKVCKAWSLTYKECTDERYWISQSNKQNIPPDSIGGVAYGLETILGKFFSEDCVEPSKSRRCWKIVRLIAEYAPDCMFEVKALIISAKVKLFGLWGCHVYCKRNHSEHRWGIDENEATIRGDFTSDTLQTTKNWSMKNDERVFFPDPLIPLSWNIPLSFFLDKEEGDSIRVSIMGRKVLLLCYYTQEVYPSSPPLVINSFREAVDQRIQIALSDGAINSNHINQARALAKARPHWISAD